MKTLEVTNKFELEHKSAEANGKVYLTQEIWGKNSPKAGVSYSSYSSLSMKVLYNLSSCELKEKKEEKIERNNEFRSDSFSFTSVCCLLGLVLQEVCTPLCLFYTVLLVLNI